MAEQQTPDNAIAQIEDGGVTHYICQNDTELTERDFDGELAPAELLGPAKPNTPGVYLLLGEKRAFYCLDVKSFLQDYGFDDVKGEWRPGTVRKLAVEAAPDNELAAAVAKDGSIYVFFQNPKGSIQFLHRAVGGDWKVATDLPSVQPSAELSVCAVVKDDTVTYFYTNEDNFIHQIVFDGHWKDVQVPLSFTTSKKSEVVATPIEDGGYTVQYTNAEGEVYAIHKGEVMLMGKYVNGVFEKDKGAEGWNWWGPRVVWGGCRRRRW